MNTYAKLAALRAAVFRYPRQISRSRLCVPSMRGLISLHEKEHESVTRCTLRFQY